MDFKQIIQSEFSQAAQVLEKFMSNDHNITLIERAAKVISDSILQGGKVISCGNGGSHCDAMHFAEELTGKYRENRKAIPAICISDPSHISCVGNDYGYEFIFSRYLDALGNKGDVLLGISTSGNSMNIIRAAEVAHEKGMKVIILSGKDGGKLAPLADVELRVPHQGYADRIQEVHIKIIHILMLLIEKQVVAN
jgi:D-sedoheptulose 7-phosphate isomerase